MTAINPLLKFFMGLMNLLYPNGSNTATQNSTQQNSDSIVVVQQMNPTDTTTSHPPKKKNYDIPLTDASAPAKSLRLITGHTAETLPRGTFELTIQHRFGEISSGAENLYGIDNLNSMRIGFDFALGNRLTVGFDLQFLHEMAGNWKSRK
jgi:Membrane bound beta barrel domain (DUF5777)